jgi:hypothetical protein
MGPSIRPSPYLPERMFPRLREQIGTALDLFVEFSTLGEYRLVAEAIPGASSAPADAPSQAPQLGGAGVHALRAAVRRTVAGGATGSTPVATPAARRLMKAAEAAELSTPHGAPHRALRKPVPRCSGDRRSSADATPRSRVRKGAPAVAEQLCPAV